MIAKEIIRLISDPQKKGQGCDRYISGDGDQEVKGVVVTFIATRRVLAEALRLGANLIITHEPTYWQDDNQQELAGDDVYQSKRQFIQENKLTIWRCHDWWHRFETDGILKGMAIELGWDGRQAPDKAHLFDLSPTTLDELARSLKKTLKIPSLRVIGREDLPVRRVALSCGAPWWKSHRAMLAEEGVDALVCGELREWETCEYARDAAAAGRDQGLIVLGHCNSEEGGMRYLANWLRDRLGNTTVQFMPAGDPFRHV